MRPHQGSGEDEVKLFIEQFLGVPRENQWMEKQTSLHLKRCLEGPAHSDAQEDYAKINLKSSPIHVWSLSQADEGMPAGAEKRSQGICM